MPTNDSSDSQSDPAGVEASLRCQLTETFEHAAYPLTDPFSLIPLLPGAPTEFRAGPVVVPALDQGIRYGDCQPYPSGSVDPPVGDLIAGAESRRRAADGSGVDAEFRDDEHSRRPVRYHRWKRGSGLSANEPVSDCGYTFNPEQIIYPVNFSTGDKT